MTIALQGIGIAAACPIAVGHAFVDARAHKPAHHVHIQADEVAGEIARLDAAIVAARRALEAVRAQAPQNAPLKIGELIDAHLLMLEDATLIEEVRAIVAAQRCNAEWALHLHGETLARLFDDMEDAYLRSRRSDIEHVVQQIQGFLRGESPRQELAAQDLEGRVVVARDLTPSDVILLRHHGVVAFVTESGGPMSHTAILSRSLGVSAVMGVHDATRYLNGNELLVVDGETGTVLADVDTLTLDFFRQRVRTIQGRQADLRTLIGHPSRTRDGRRIKLLANLELPEDVDAARDAGADGVGLYRTEFLFMNRSDLPDEEEHLATYSGMLAGLGGIPITIRTLDLGLDKQHELLDPYNSTVRNPALGLRAIRLCLKEPEIFRPQLRAILRASALGPVRLMLPLVTSVSEIDAVLGLIEQLKGQLDREGLRYDAAMPVGAMIEVPAAALAAHAIAKRMDFLSIGTNDLIQYTLAIDRLDDAVNYLFDPTHPAILRLVRMIIEAGTDLHIPVSMCGEMAGDPRFTRLLIGLGLSELSMQPGSILTIKEIVLQADSQELQARTRALFEQLDQAEPGELLDALNAA